MMMTKKEATEHFVSEHLPGIPFGDKPALAESWNNYTDFLCKEGFISQKQYDNWLHPKITDAAWRKANCHCECEC